MPPAAPPRRRTTTPSSSAGTAVPLGHPDTDSGPAVFVGLTELRRGRIVEARRADGTRRSGHTVGKIKS